MLTTTTVITSDGRKAKFARSIRVRTVLGTGNAIYVDADGWVGVRHDGEDRVEEIGAEHVQVLS